VRKIKDISVGHLALMTLFAAASALEYSVNSAGDVPGAIYFIALETLLVLAYMGLDPRTIIDAAVFALLSFIMALVLYGNAQYIQSYGIGGVFPALLQAAIVMAGGFVIMKMFRNRDEDMQMKKKADQQK